MAQKYGIQEYSWVVLGLVNLLVFAVSGFRSFEFLILSLSSFLVLAMPSIDVPSWIVVQSERVVSLAMLVNYAYLSYFSISRTSATRLTPVVEFAVFAAVAVLSAYSLSSRS